MRGVRGVGLVLIDKGRGDVDRLVGGVVGGAHDPVGAGARNRSGAAQHHEGVLRRDLVAGAGDAVGPVRAQRIIGRQRNIDGAVAAFGDQVQSVIEELAEEGHPAVEGRAQPLVRGDIGNDQRAVFGFQTLGLEHQIELGLGRVARRLFRDLVEASVGVDGDNRTDEGGVGGAHHGQVAIDVRRAGEGQGGDDGGRVVEAHVGDKIRDQARIGVRDIARVPAVHARRRGADRAVVVVGDGLAAAQRHAVVALVDEVRVQQPRHRLVRRAPELTSFDQVVVAAVHRAQTIGRLRVRDGQGQGRIKAGRGVPGPVGDDPAAGVQTDFRQGRAVGVRLGDPDLLQDEFQIMLIERDHLCLRGGNAWEEAERDRAQRRRET